jgi:hypothetical protein
MELEKLKMDSLILPATPVVPILTDADLPDDSTLSEVPALAPIAEDVPATQAPTGVVPPARPEEFDIIVWPRGHYPLTWPPRRCCDSLTGSPCHIR